MDDKSEPGRPQGGVSDTERDQALERLRAAAAEGGLTYQELVERTGRAYAARTAVEVVAVTGDLPATPSRPVLAFAGKAVAGGRHRQRAAHRALDRRTPVDRGGSSR